MDNCHTKAVRWDTWMHPNVPVESILDASLTVSPQMSKTGFVAPITPHTRGPTLIPKNKVTSYIKLSHRCASAVLRIALTIVFAFKQNMRCHMQLLTRGNYKIFNFEIGSKGKESFYAQPNVVTDSKLKRVEGVNVDVFKLVPHFNGKVNEVAQM